MNKAIVLGVVAAACLVGCKKSSNPSAPAAKPDDAVQLKLKQLAGAGATDCGRFDVHATNEQSKQAGDCGTQAAQGKHPFYVAYDMPGMTTGVAGNAEGKLFAVELQGSGTGAQLQSGPCPAELRMAHSGRLTCFIPGTMGLNPSASDPHSGVNISPGGSQGGMIPQPFAPPAGSGNQKPPQRKN